MSGALMAYVVSVGSLLFCAASALTLFYVVDHFDPPAKDKSPIAAEPRAEAAVREKVAV